MIVRWRSWRWRAIQARDRSRQGLSYPESRVVVLGSSGEPTVLHAPGFEPDAAIALGPNDHTLVVSYAAGESARVQESVRVSLLDAHGALAAPARTVENSAGLKVDSPATAWREGYAVVLGRETAGDTMREAIYGFDRQGEANHAPWALTDAQGDDSIGRYRVGLAAANDGAVLRASWTVVAAAQAGVWTRTLNDGHLDEPRRLAARPAWGSEVMPDGGGILYRAGGERSAPVELFFAPAEAGDSVSLGAGWDPSTAYVRGHLLVAGVTLADADGHDLNTLVAAALPGQPLRAIPADQVFAAMRLRPPWTTISPLRRTEPPWRGSILSTLTLAAWLGRACDASRRTRLGHSSIAIELLVASRKSNLPRERSLGAHPGGRSQSAHRFSPHGSRLEDTAWSSTSPHPSAPRLGFPSLFSGEGSMPIVPVPIARGPIATVPVVTAPAAPVSVVPGGDNRACDGSCTPAAASATPGRVKSPLLISRRRDEGKRRFILMREIGEAVSVRPEPALATREDRVEGRHPGGRGASFDTAPDESGPGSGRTERRSVTSTIPPTCVRNFSTGETHARQAHGWGEVKSSTGRAPPVALRKGPR